MEDTITGSSAERLRWWWTNSGGTERWRRMWVEPLSVSGTAQLQTLEAGGGGGSESEVTGGDGGDGVVIIRSSSTAASTTGSPVETTVGSDYVYTFTRKWHDNFLRSKEWRLIFQIVHQTGNSYSSRPNIYI